MVYIALKPIKTKKAEYQAGDKIETSNEDAIKALLDNGAIRPLKEVFDTLWKSHVENLKKYALTDTEIKKQRPDIYKQIQDAVKDMDSAWLKWDLTAFKEAMHRVETLYFKALQEIPNW